MKTRHVSFTMVFVVAFVLGVSISQFLTKAHAQSSPALSIDYHTVALGESKTEVVTKYPKAPFSATNNRLVLLDMPTGHLFGSIDFDGKSRVVTVRKYWPGTKNDVQTFWDSFYGSLAEVVGKDRKLAIVTFNSQHTTEMHSESVDIEFLSHRISISRDRITSAEQTFGQQAGSANGTYFDVTEIVDSDIGQELSRKH